MSTQYYNFRRLIEKYSSEFKAIVLKGGDYDNKGDWVKGEKEEITLYGAVISHRESKVYRSEGNLTAKDKRLFVFKPIAETLFNATIIYEGDEYSLEETTQNAKFTGVYAYNLKYISAFKEGSK